MTSKCFSARIPPCRVIFSIITGKTAGNCLQPIKRKNQRVRLERLHQTRLILRETNQGKRLKKNTFPARPCLHETDQKPPQFTTFLTAGTPAPMVCTDRLRDPCPHVSPSGLLRRGGLNTKKDRQTTGLCLPLCRLYRQQAQPYPPVLRPFPEQRTGRHRCRSLE